jgi:hypothetical protein
VNVPAYSSLTAFLAHRRALRALAERGPEQSALLAELDAPIAELGPADRDALEADNGGGERERQRAERHLTLILRQRGLLAG